MDIKIFLLMNCAIAVYCQSTIANRNDASRDCEFFEDVKFERETNRRLLINLEQAALSNTAQAMHGMKSQVEEIRQQCLRETQVIRVVKSQVEEIQQQNRNEAQAMQDMKSQVEEIQQQNRNQAQTIRDINSIVEEIRQQNRNQDQAIQGMRSQIEETRQQNRNQDQAVQRLNSQIEGIRQAVRKNERRRGCPFGFEYLPEAGHCFKLIFDSLNWYNASDRCRQLMPGVHLAAITSAEESSSIAKYIQQELTRGDKDHCSRSWPNGGYSVWIGGQLKRLNQCGDPFVWRTLNGIEIPFNYTNWAPRQPDCSEGGENRESCAQISSAYNYTWNDIHCSWTFCALCEI